MDSAEFTDWQIEYQLEPWDEARADLRMGILASAIANLHTTLRETLLALWVKGWHRSDSPPYLPRDFIPDFHYTPPTPAPVKTVQSAAQLQAFFMNLTQQTGGTIH